MPKASDKVKVNVKERVEDEHCDLSLSELTEVPVREIASFKRIKILDLSSNRLVTLGRNFTTLTRLVKLDLSKNQIRILPDDFGQLDHLRHLDLYDNCLEHLPLSFGRLVRLRYLDLKGNPLTPAWQKVVGRCSTQKDCQQAAKNTVSVCANFKTESLAVQEQSQVSAPQMSGGGDADGHNNMAKSNGVEVNHKKSAINNKANKKSKSKAKSGANSENELTIKPIHNTAASAKTTNQKNNQKSRKSSTGKSGSSHSSSGSRWFSAMSGVAVSSLVTFMLLFVLNILIIYMIMFKNPDIADKLVEYIPHQYRDWILTKTEIFRLRVTDWISEFRTPPEEH